MPGAHSVHAVRPSTSPTEPAWQLWHVLAPVKAVYIPGTHAVHRAWSATENVPAAQCEHVAPSAALKLPASHTSGEHDDAARRDVKPAAHSVHSVAEPAE